MNNIIIAVDGPSGTGKGTISKHVAKYFGFDYLDTGLYYRAIAYLVLNYNISLLDEERICELTNDVKIMFKDGYTIVNGMKLSTELRSNEVNDIVSQVSSIVKVKLLINDKIRNYTADKNIIIDGRDIGTLVYPNATVKLYIDASSDTRARRRFNQNIEMGIESNYEDILKSINKRDENDKNKEFGALKQAKDAILIDTTNSEIDETIKEVIKVIEGVIK